MVLHCVILVFANLQDMKLLLFLAANAVWFTAN